MYVFHFASKLETFPGELLLSRGTIAESRGPCQGVFLVGAVRVAQNPIAIGPLRGPELNGVASVALAVVCSDSEHKLRFGSVVHKGPVSQNWLVSNGG